MKRLVGEGRGVLMLWTLLAVVSVFSMAAPARATDGALAPPVDAPAGRALQDWGLPLTIVELGVLVAVIVPLVIGVTEFAKQFGVTGKWSRLFAMVLGVVIGGLVVAAALNVLPGWAGIAIVILLGGLLAGLAATGLYDLQNKSVKANAALGAELAALGGKQALQTRIARDVALLAEFVKRQEEARAADTIRRDTLAQAYDEMTRANAQRLHAERVKEAPAEDPDAPQIIPLKGTLPTDSGYGNAPGPVYKGPDAVVTNTRAQPHGQPDEAKRLHDEAFLDVPLRGA